MALRWGLIGCGDIVRKLRGRGPAGRSGGALVSVSQGDESRLEACKDEVGAQKSFSEWREQVLDPDIDAVYIATPVSQHVEQAIAAAEAGKASMCCARSRWPWMPLRATA